MSDIEPTEAMTDTEKLAEEFPHIDALSRGCMSGKLIDWPQFQPECARVMRKLALALSAIEAAKGIVSQTFYQHNDIGDWYCECCHRVVNSRTTHKGNCDLQEFLEAVTKLEAAKC